MASSSPRPSLSASPSNLTISTNFLFFQRFTQYERDSTEERSFFPLAFPVLFRSRELRPRRDPSRVQQRPQDRFIRLRSTTGTLLAAPPPPRGHTLSVCRGPVILPELTRRTGYPLRGWGRERAGPLPNRSMIPHLVHVRKKPTWRNILPGGAPMRRRDREVRPGASHRLSPP